MTPLEWFGWQSPSVSSVVVASAAAASSAANAVNPTSTAGAGSGSKLPTVSATKRELQSADECVVGIGLSLAAGQELNTAGLADCRRVLSSVFGEIRRAGRRCAQLLSSAFGLVGRRRC